MLSTNLRDWLRVHVFYNTRESSDIKNDLISELETSWKEFVFKKTPNGKLFIQNKFFEQLQEDEIYLAHLTPNLHNILQDNLIYPSGGCLVGSIYCTPVTKTSKGLRLHNLGSFIYNKEVPKIYGVNPQILLIKIKLPERCRNRLIGIDYLRLGSIHFGLFKELEYLLSGKERYVLEKICVIKTQELLPLLIMVQNKLHGKKVKPRLFFELYFNQIKNNPILAYILFEVFCEFTGLYQKTKQSEKWKEEGEIYSWYFKDSVFSLADNSCFNLRAFQPNIKDIYKYLNKLKCINKISYENVEQYFFNRLSFLLYARLWNYNNIVNDWQKPILTFDNLSKYFRPLLGHTIHRELRNFGRYPNFYYYFDQLKALKVWNYWNHNNIVVPFNGVMPKGETGINPAFPDLEFEVFKTCVHKVNEDEIFLTPKTRIEIQLVPRLIDLKFTTLRNKYYDEKNKNQQVNT